MDNNEKLHEAIVSLERARLAEREERLQAEALLEGLRVLSRSESTTEIFNNLVDVIQPVFLFEDAFVLLSNSQGVYQPIAASNQKFMGMRWKPSELIQRLEAGACISCFDVHEIPDWKNQPEEVLSTVTSAFHVAFQGLKRNAMLVGVHSKRGFFSKQSTKSVKRFTPLIEEALVRSEAISELREGQNRLQAVMESMVDAIVTLNGEGCITSVNRAAEAMFGESKKAVLGRKIKDYFVDSEQLNRWFETGLSVSCTNEKTGYLEVLGKRRDGTKFPIELWCNLVELETSSFELMVARDLSERKQLEQQLLQVKKLEAIGQLAAGISHEINTPMQYVQNNVSFFKTAFKDLCILLNDCRQLLDESGIPLTGEAKDHLERIDLDFLMEEVPESIDDAQDGINRVVKIVSAMKEFSHPGIDKKIATDLNRALENIITVSRNEWKYVAEMKTDFDPDLPMVSCLADQLNQVVLNLIINGAHAIDETGASVPDNSGTITLSTKYEGDWVELRVSDTGSGIPKEICDRVFDPFFTTKEVGKGTGQGLAIVHDVVVQKHGGTIDFDTATGRGTTFIIRLPITSKNDEASV